MLKEILMSSNVLDVNMPDKIFSCINCYTEGHLNFFFLQVRVKMYYSHPFCSMEKVHLKPYNTFIIRMLENPFSSFVHRSSMDLIQSLVTLFLIHSLTRVIHLR